MPYTVTLTNGSVLTTIPDGTVDNSTSLGLLGRDYADYGAIVADDFVRLMEHFASTSPPPNPLTGQVWFDTSVSSLRVWAGSAWQLVGSSSGGGSTSPTTLTIQTSTTNGGGLFITDPAAPTGMKNYRIRVRDDAPYSGHWVLESLNDDQTIKAVVLDTDSNGYVVLANSPSTGDNSKAIATTGYVQAQKYAPLASPVFTGSPTAPTPAAGDNTTKLATTAFVVARTRTVLTSALNLYVSTTGSDSNDGLTPGTPFATIQTAVNIAFYRYDTDGNEVIINVASGTYTTGASVVGRLLGLGTLRFVGNTSDPSTCIINLSSPGVCFSAWQSAVISIQGFTLQATSGDSTTPWKQPGACIHSSGSAEVFFENVIFGAAQYAHVWAQVAGYVSTLSSTSTYKISGGAQSHWVANSAGSIAIATATATITGAVAFSGPFVNADTSSVIWCPGMQFPGSGNVTGMRYNAARGASIDTGSSGNASYFPGTVNGTATTGYYN